MKEKDYSEENLELREVKTQNEKNFFEMISEDWLSHSLKQVQLKVTKKWVSKKLQLLRNIWINLIIFILEFKRSSTTKWTTSFGKNSFSSDVKKVTLKIAN